MQERWVIKEIYEEGDVLVQIIDMTGQRSSREDFKTIYEMRHIFGLKDGEKLKEGDAKLVTEDDLADADKRMVLPAEEQLKLARDMEELPDEVKQGLKQLFENCRDAHEQQDIFESDKYEELIGEYPCLEKYREIQLEKMAELLKLPKKTYADDWDKIRAEFEGMSAPLRKKIKDHLEHSFNHPSLEEVNLAYPGFAEKLLKNILDTLPLEGKFENKARIDLKVKPPEIDDLKEEEDEEDISDEVKHNRKIIEGLQSSGDDEQDEEAREIAEAVARARAAIGDDDDPSEEESSEDKE